MRSIRVLTVSLLIAGASLALAALPPHYQRIAELTAIVQNSGIAEAFGVNRPIVSVEYVDVDLYRVTGGNCHMFVTLENVPLADGMVGARQFNVVPGELACS